MIISANTVELTAIGYIIRTNLTQANAPVTKMGVAQLALSFRSLQHMMIKDVGVSAAFCEIYLPEDTFGSTHHMPHLFFIRQIEKCLANIKYPARIVKKFFPFRVIL